MIDRFGAPGNRLGRRWLLAGLIALASGCVLADEDGDDPYESFNRAMFAVNEVADQYAAKPVAQAYDSATPLPVKAGIGNFFGNVGDLWIGVNNALQGKLTDAGSDLGRLLINSTVGIFGLFDVASELGLEKHDEDLGQTLAVWGVGGGPYLFWPLIGPRNMRDTVTWVADSYADPVWSLHPIAARNSMVVVRFVDVRASLLPADKVIEAAALDKYSYIRGAYQQRRRNQIFDGHPPRLED